MMKMWSKAEYGVYAYYISLATILMALAEFGTPNVFRRQYSQAKDSSLIEVFSNIFVLRLFFIIPIAAFFLYLAWHFNSWFFLCYSVISLLIIFRLNEYSLEVQFKNGVIAKTKSLGYILGLITKVILLLSGANLEYIALVTLFEHCVFIVVFMLNAQVSFSFKVISLAKIKSLFFISLALAASFMVTVLGGKIYTLIVFNVLGANQTGVFAFSARLIEILLVPTQVFLVVLLPLLMKVKESKSFNELYSDAVCIGFYAYLVLLAVFVYVQFPLLTLLIDDADEISNFVAIYSITVPLMVLNAFSNVFYTAKGANKLILIKSVVFLILALLLGSYLISMLGLTGIIYSTLCSYVLVDILFYFSFAVAKEELLLRMRCIVKVFEIKKVLNRLISVKVGN